ncbi:MAG TPA: recombinase family protein [Polyangiaceae bacterium]|nr:recombinase family protein [Polyangiaceae bacterium]
MPKKHSAFASARERPRAIVLFISDEPEGGRESGQQREAFAKWASRQRVEVAQWVVEAPGSVGQPLPTREALVEALAALQLQVASDLVVGSLRQLARDAADFTIIERMVAQAGARLRAAFGREGEQEFPAKSVPLARFNAALDEYERLSWKVRVRVAQAAPKPGNRPWGYKKGRTGHALEPDDYEQNVVAVVRHMRAQGYKLREIVDYLHDMGATTRTGRPIGMTRVFEIVHGGRKKTREDEDERGYDIPAKRETSRAPTPPRRLVEKLKQGRRVR